MEELKDIKIDMLAGLNTLIYAPRRFGKTSLILKALKELEKTDSVKYVFFDLMYLSTVEEFINKYFNALAKTLEEPTDKIINFFKSILKIRPNINVSFDENGNPNFSLVLGGEDIDKTFEEVLNIPLSFVKNGKKIVIVFDEFQEITNLKLESKLRSVLQLHSNKIAYIFMGSKKSLLHQMFLDKNRPFYKSVKHFKIKEINANSWKEFILSRYANTGKKIDGTVVDKILTITKGFPYYTQQFAYEIWNITQNEANVSLFEKALKIIMGREEDLFLVEYDNLTSNQKKTLKIIIEKNGQNVYDEQYLAKYKIKSGSLQIALKNLLERDIVDKNSEGYYLQDPLFEYWLKQMSKA
ncbi:MAG: ATP-binding protein [Sulfurospirillaceae bacterium]|nr:ATP-binding protein [Sulfurospirillaceae bacterium]